MKPAYNAAMNVAAAVTFRGKKKSRMDRIVTVLLVLLRGGIGGGGDGARASCSTRSGNPATEPN